MFADWDCIFRKMVADRDGRPPYPVMAGLDPTRCTHLVPQPDAKVAAGRPQSRIRVQLRAIGSIGRGSLHDTTSKTYACNQLKRRWILRCVNLVGLVPAIRSGTSLQQMGDSVTGRDEWVAP